MSSSPDLSSPIRPGELAAAIAWLTDGARSAVRSQDVLAELCARLIDCGLPLWRVAVFVRTLHPVLLGRSFVWRPDREVEVSEAPFQLADDATFLLSPVQRIYLTGEALRRRLADPDCPDDFPFLEELRAENVSDYLALPLNFTNGEIHVATFTTRRPEGFASEHVVALETIAAPLARVAEVRALRVTAISLLNSYVGHQAGERILAGRIRRGDVEDIRAVIWLSDMRGFTRRADTMAPASLIELLNLFYDNLVPAIEAEGGEVLKFMGDGLLAIFRISESADLDAACASALRAAKQAQKNIAALPNAGLGDTGEALRFGLRATCWGSALRQYRRGRAPRLHLHRPFGQSRRAPGKNRVPSRSNRCRFGRLRPAFAGRIRRVGRLRTRRISPTGNSFRASRREG
jgi:adenylate cyclase